MSKSRTIKLLLIALFAVGVMMPTTAMAQDDENAQVEGLDGFEVPVGDKGTPWAAVLFSLVFTGCACALAFKNSKRTHLD
ncbi:MAG: hypothetical protein ACLFVU_14515 [Phycisphaerae bacterium]